MGGRGASSSTAKISKVKFKVDLGSMTDRQLDSEIAKVRKIMADNAHAHVAYLQGFGGSKRESDRYVEAQANHIKLQHEKGLRLDVKAAEKAAAAANEPKPYHTFVNGFGEATHFYYTTPTYERWRKRMEKAVLRNMGY